MTYLVTNLTTGEEAAALNDLELAKQLADRLFNGEDPYWAVIERKVVYRAGDAEKPE